jgi:hypothetical protein
MIRQMILQPSNCGGHGQPLAHYQAAAFGMMHVKSVPACKVAPNPQKAEGWDGRTGWRSHSGRQHRPVSKGTHDPVGGEGID